MLVLRDDPNSTKTDEPAQVSDLERIAHLDSTIVCAACGAIVTAAKDRIAVQGAHEHRFMNPAGFTYHIGCFASAIGCTIIGPDSLEYPWFPGFSWRYAMCGSCGRHLGWHFRKARTTREEESEENDAGFFGLILDRLVEPQSV